MTNKDRQKKFRDARKEAGLVSYRRYIRPELVAVLDKLLKQLK